MATLSECPGCHKKWSLIKKVCTGCGTDLDAAKRRSKGNRVLYWIRYRLPDGTQRLEKVGHSVAEAKDRDPSGRKDEAVVAELTANPKMTFDQLSAWYLNLEKTKVLKSFWLVELCLKKFNTEFGRRTVKSITLADLENYQIKRMKAGKAPATVDHEIGKMKTAILKAFDNDLVSGKTMKTFRRCKKTLKPGSDVRDRILSADEFEKLLSHSSRYLTGILKMAYFTGMRRGEILSLTWDRVDLKGSVIRLTADMTKDAQARTVSICDDLYKELKQIPRAIHDPHVFLFRGKPVSHIRTGLRLACKKAGIEYGRFVEGGFIFHDLRHTFNTNMRKSGVAESVIMAITGHSTRQMFDRYNTIDDDDVHNAVHTLGRWLDGQCAQNVHKISTG